MVGNKVPLIGCASVCSGVPVLTEATFPVGGETPCNDVGECLMCEGFERNLWLSVITTGIQPAKRCSRPLAPTGAICCFQAGETSNSLRQNRRQVQFARRQPRWALPAGVSFLGGIRAERAYPATPVTIGWFVHDTGMVLACPLSSNHLYVAVLPAQEPFPVQHPRARCEHACPLQKLFRCSATSP